MSRLKTTLSMICHRLFRGFFMMTALLSLYALLGCAHPVQKSPMAGQPDERASALAVEPKPATGGEAVDTSLGLPQQAKKNGERKTVYYTGSGKLLEMERERKAGVDVQNQETVDVNFNEVDIHTVIDVILGETLGLKYVTDPNVNGNLTLQSTQPLYKDTLFSTLEEALKLKGYAIVERDGLYNVVPLKDAPRRIKTLRGVHPASSELPGFGVQIVSLKFTNPHQIAKILEPFAPQGAIVSVDAGRGIILLAGTRDELATMMDVIETFDVNWLEGMSFAFFEAQNVDVKTLADEIKNIFDAPENPMAGMVRFIPIPRISSVLAISAQPNLLKQVETWIGRLDQGGEAPGRRIFIYYVQNAKATSLASSLSSIITGKVSPISSKNGEQTQATTSTSSLGTSSMGQSSINQSSASAGAAQGGASDTFESAGLRIVPNDEDNSLLILATPQEYQVIEAALKKMDAVPRQVMIEVSLAEVSLTKELKYGLQWYFESGAHTATLSNSRNGSVSSEFPGFSYVYSGPSGARAVLNALESVTKVKVLSSPKLLVLNNQSATLQVGDQVPIATQSAQSTAGGNSPILTTVQLRDTGVILHITPRVNQGGLVLLDITQEVSNVTKTISSGIDSPTIQQRKITTSLAIQDGETIAMGGLIREGISRGKSGIPLLKDIPLIGSAFSTTDNTLDRTELIILITPRVISDSRRARDTMDYLRREFKYSLPAAEPKPWK